MIEQDEIEDSFINYDSVKMYGFQLYTKKQVDEVSQRLYTGHTKSTETVERERQKYTNNYITNSLICAKAKNAYHAGRCDVIKSSGEMKPIDCKEFQKLIRRLQRPTSNYSIYSLPKVKPDSIAIRQPVPSSEFNKTLGRLVRSTVSSASKALRVNADVSTGSAQYWANNGPSSKMMKPEWLEKHVKRVTTPTLASIYARAGQQREDNSHIFYNSLVHVKDVPLISGLPRSKNVSEIVNRLTSQKSKLPLS